MQKTGTVPGRLGRGLHVSPPPPFARSGQQFACLRRTGATNSDTPRPAKDLVMPLPESPGQCIDFTWMRSRTIYFESHQAGNQT